MANQHEIDRLTAIVTKATDKLHAAHGEPAKTDARKELDAAQKALDAEKAKK